MYILPELLSESSLLASPFSSGLDFLRPSAERLLSLWPTASETPGKDLLTLIGILLLDPNLGLELVRRALELVELGIFEWLMDLVGVLLELEVELVGTTDGEGDCWNWFILDFVSCKSCLRAVTWSCAVCRSPSMRVASCWFSSTILRNVFWKKTWKNTINYIHVYILIL